VAPKINTFAAELKHFAKSVDIVDDKTFDGVRKLIYRYVRTELDAEYFELMSEQAIGSERGLRTFWSSEEKDHVWPIRSPDGAFTNPVTAAFVSDRPLWIVSQDKEPLSDSAAYEDQWSHTAELPAYHPTVDQAIRTTVVVPLRRRRVLGVYYLETGSYVAITDIAKTELQLLGDAIAILFELYDVNKSQSRMTQEAIFELEDILKSAKFPKLAKPGIFVAYPKKAEGDVKTVIQQVLRGFADRLEIADWGAMTDAGNITAQLAKRITRSKFGVCYLSQPADGTSKHAYVDNPNVVFEAGMLHALTNLDSEDAEPTGWIPIREKDSPPAPFDFAGERTIEVPRLGDNQLNEQSFRDMLEKHVKKLLRED
jgi:hypothetical protein